MRTFFVLLSLALVGSLTGSALGANNSPLTIRASSLKVLYGHEVTLSGRLSSGAAGQTVAILSTPSGLGPAKVASVKTTATGVWKAQVGPAIGTTYTARVGSIVSAPISIGVAPALTTRVLGSGRISAHVAAGTTFRGRTLQLQQANGSAWSTIQRAVLNRTSNAIFKAPTSDAGPTLRIAMSINQAGTGYLGAASHAFVYRPVFVSLTTSTNRLLDGHAVTLSGRVSSEKKGQHVEILAWPYGRTAATRIAGVTTGPNGWWTFQARPGIQTSYTAHWGSATSRLIAVGVEPRITVSLFGDGRIQTHVAAGRHLAGRMIQLQQLSAANQWSTIKQMRLDRSSSAIFAAPVSGAATLRVALSVNQAGVGLLGATSHSFVYHSV